MDPETEWRWHMWRFASTPELAEYWRGRWEQRVKERASNEARSTDQNGTESSNVSAAGCAVCSD